MIETCPDCGQKLEKVDAMHFCLNSDCPSRKIESLIHYASRHAMDIDGLGDNIVSQLVDKGLVVTPADLYKLTVEDFLKLDLIAEKSAQNLHNVIQASKNPTLARFINSLGIRHVGKETSVLLANKFGSLEKFKQATDEQVQEIDGIGDKISVSILDFFSNSYNNVLLSNLEQYGVIPKNAKVETISDNLKDTTFVITGTLSKPRDYFANMIKKHGGKVSSSVSKKTSFVLAGESPGSKYDKAESLGVTIIDESKFRQLIGE